MLAPTPVGIERTLLGQITHSGHLDPVAEQDRPVGADQFGDQGNERRSTLSGCRLGHLGDERQGGEVRVDMSSLDRSDILDRDPVDSVDLAHHERDQSLIGKHYDELVDHAARSALEHLDTEDVPANSTYATRHLSKSARAIGQPDPDDNGVHGERLRPCGFNRVTRRCGSTELDEAALQVAHRLGDALLVLDEREAHETLTTGTETNSGRERDVALADQHRAELH